VSESTKQESQSQVPGELGRVIKSVTIWQNGLTMVFDQFGEQMPEYQGEAEEMIPLIRSVYRGVIHKGIWDVSVTPMLD
jgi:hypothetical protein